MSNYRVKHSQVGPYREGQIFSLKDLKEKVGDDVDVDRLLNLGAIETAGENDKVSTAVNGPESVPVKRTGNREVQPDKVAKEEDQPKPETKVEPKSTVADKK
jgi:hypothetical protein